MSCTTEGAVVSVVIFISVYRWFPVLKVFISRTSNRRWRRSSAMWANAYHSRRSHAVPFQTVRNSVLLFQSQSYPTIPNTIRSYHFKNCSHVLPFQHCHILPYNTVAYHPNTGCAISISILCFIYKKVKRDQQRSLLRIWKRRISHLTI